MDVAVEGIDGVDAYCYSKGWNVIDLDGNNDQYRQGLVMLYPWKGTDLGLYQYNLHLTCRSGEFRMEIPGVKKDIKLSDVYYHSGDPLKYTYPEDGSLISHVIPSDPNADDITISFPRHSQTTAPNFYYRELYLRGTVVVAPPVTDFQIISSPNVSDQGQKGEVDIENRTITVHVSPKTIKDSSSIKVLTTMNLEGVPFAERHGDNVKFSAALVRTGRDATAVNLDCTSQNNCMPEMELRVFAIVHQCTNTDLNDKPFRVDTYKVTFVPDLVDNYDSLTINVDAVKRGKGFPSSPRTAIATNSQLEGVPVYEWMEGTNDELPLTYTPDDFTVQPFKQYTGTVEIPEAAGNYQFLQDLTVAVNIVDGDTVTPVPADKITVKRE